MNEEQLLSDIDNTLKAIAHEAAGKANHSRIEYDDMLQEARVGAWMALQLSPKRDMRQYAIGAGRKAVKQAISKLLKDFLHHCDNYGLESPVTQ